MDTADPHVAQKIVSDYAALLERHAREEVYPAPVGALPYSKEVIKASIRTSIAALNTTGALTDDLRDYLEVAYISLADYVEDDLVRLMREYHAAGATLAADSRLAREKLGSAAWEQLMTTSRLVGEVARTIAEETEQLRREFREITNAPVN